MLYESGIKNNNNRSLTDCVDNREITTDGASAFCHFQDHSLAAERLKNHPRHMEYLERVPQSQLEKLHIILRDFLQGFSLEHSLASFTVDPDEDLNKLSDEELARKKGKMEELFERNQRCKDDPDFVYDIQVDFTRNAEEICSWDESDNGI